MHASKSSLYVPPELLSEIFTHCDVPTLASISQVSSTCLELTFKLLYTDITLRDTKSLALLLKLEVSTPFSSRKPLRVTGDGRAIVSHRARRAGANVPPGLPRLLSRRPVLPCQIE